ncbi:MAG: hypothetical protein JRI72_00240 [Deltaproteobacteria bacterium]|nr:hypothetical protein [Deltaproteobacteria bacterium]
MKLLYEGEVVGEIMTNRSMHLEECFELLGIDIEEEEGGIPVWDPEKFEMQY